MPTGHSDVSMFLIKIPYSQTCFGFCQVDENEPAHTLKAHVFFFHATRHKEFYKLIIANLDEWQTLFSLLGYSIKHLDGPKEPRIHSIPVSFTSVYYASSVVSWEGSLPMGGDSVATFKNKTS